MFESAKRHYKIPSKLG